MRQLSRYSDCLPRAQVAGTWTRVTEHRLLVQVYYELMVEWPGYDVIWI
jgi:hypothetical protein